MSERIAIESRKCDDRILALQKEQLHLGELMATMADCENSEGGTPDVIAAQLKVLGQHAKRTDEALRLDLRLQGAIARRDIAGMHEALDAYLQFKKPVTSRAGRPADGAPTSAQTPLSDRPPAQNGKGQRAAEVTKSSAREAAPQASASMGDRARPKASQALFAAESRHCRERILAANAEQTRIGESMAKLANSTLTGGVTPEVELELQSLGEQSKRIADKLHLEHELLRAMADQDNAGATRALDQLLKLKQ